jgi:hypothetical protein
MRAAAAALLLALCGCWGRVGGGASAPKPVQLPNPYGFVLEERAAESGITFRHTTGSRLPLTIVETMGSGCALVDLDGDGNVDALLLNSGQNARAAKQIPGSRLYRNLGGGKFADVTSQSGLVIDFYAMGCCVGDYDNDGVLDLFVTGFGRNALFRGLGGMRFADVTQAAGILQRPGAWGMSCCFTDVNRDGLLDLYVANYVRYDEKIPFCTTNNVPHGCTPSQYPTQNNELYINLGGGRFAERAVELGAADKDGAGLGLVVTDFDNDGWPDIFVANDGTPNALLMNNRGRFVNLGHQSSVAFAENGDMRAGMGTDAADVDGDGLMDIVITNFQHEPNSLYRNEGRRMFHEISFPSGVGRAAIGRNGFGVVFADFDGDGQQDLYVGNGHVYDNVAKFDDGATFEQLDQLLLHRQGARFEVADPKTGVMPDRASVTRSVAVGDVNNDGAPDVLINSVDRAARLLINRPKSAVPWIAFRLRGTKSNRAAIGARVEVSVGGALQMKEVRSGCSYLSQSDLRPLFRFGGGVSAGQLKVRIRWPSGGVQEVQVAGLNRVQDVTER